ALRQPDPQEFLLLGQASLIQCPGLQVGSGNRARGEQMRFRAVPSRRQLLAHLQKRGHLLLQSRKFVFFYALLQRAPLQHSLERKSKGFHASSLASDSSRLVVSSCDVW